MAGFRLLAVSHPPFAVVEIVNVAVPPAVPVRFTGVVEPKLSVGRLTAPLGWEEMVALSETPPVKPPVGATPMVDVLPVVAPGWSLTDVPVIVNPALGVEPTVTSAPPAWAMAT